MGCEHYPFLASVPKISGKRLHPINKSIFLGWSNVGSASCSPCKWGRVFTLVAACIGRSQVTFATTAAFRESCGVTPFGSLIVKLKVEVLFPVAEPCAPMIDNSCGCLRSCRCCTAHLVMGEMDAPVSSSARATNFFPEGASSNTLLFICNVGSKFPVEVAVLTAAESWFVGSGDVSLVSTTESLCRLVWCCLLHVLQRLVLRQSLVP